ncbi:MAG: DUF2784 family protein [Dehalococcoidia bacterium]|nr:MAG: DUF2784 family protein [Dehalococcoidia bacterium]
MVWKILADTVMVLHLLLIGFFAVSIVLLALGFFRGQRNWQFFYRGVTVVVIGLGAASWAGILRSCSLTDLEYMLRRLYDPSQNWMRTRSLLGTIIFNTTGIEVPEFAFTIALGIGTAVMIGSLILRRA